MVPAAHGQFGPDLAIAHRPIVVLDLNLAGVGGLEILDRLKALPEI
jgi:CheY-like chemotaxis protein